MNIAHTAGAGACAGVLALLGACGSSAARAHTAHASTPRGHRSAAASTTCRAGGRSVCLTRSSGGRTIGVGVGWTVAVELRTPDGVWSVPTQVGAHLLRQQGGVDRQAGAVAVSYRALAPGRTALRAFERPVCPPMRACPQYILVWQVELRVSRR
jgi:hypothetical protein